MIATGFNPSLLPEVRVLVGVNPLPLGVTKSPDVTPHRVHLRRRRPPSCC